MTVKELAAELGVSKPTVLKVMDELDIQAAMTGNRYELTGEQCSQIKAKITKISESPIVNEAEILESETLKSLKSENETLKSLIEVLQQQLTEKDRQITDLTELLKAADKKQSELLQQLKNAQALQGIQATTIAQITTAQKPQTFWGRVFKKNRGENNDEASAD